MGPPHLPSTTSGYVSGDQGASFQGPAIETHNPHAPPSQDVEPRPTAPSDPDDSMDDESDSKTKDSRVRITLSNNLYGFVDGAKHGNVIFRGLSHLANLS